MRDWVAVEVARVAPTDDDGEWWCEARPMVPGNMMGSADDMVIKDDQSMSKGGGCEREEEQLWSSRGVERDERREAGVVDGAVVGGVSANETAAVEGAGEKRGQLKSAGEGADERVVERDEEIGMWEEETVIEEEQSGAKTNAGEESKRMPPPLSCSAQVRNRSPTPAPLLPGCWRSVDACRWLSHCRPS